MTSFHPQYFVRDYLISIVLTILLVTQVLLESRSAIFLLFLSWHLGWLRCHLVGQGDEILLNPTRLTAALCSNGAHLAALRSKVTNLPEARGLLGVDSLSYSMPRQ